MRGTHGTHVHTGPCILYWYLHTQFTLLGRIISIQDLSTKLTIVMNDGTGEIELSYYLDSGSAETVRIYNIYVI